MILLLLLTLLTVAIFGLSYFFRKFKLRSALSLSSSHEPPSQEGDNGPKQR